MRSPRTKTSGLHGAARLLHPRATPAGAAARLAQIASARDSPLSEGRSACSTGGSIVSGTRRKPGRLGPYVDGYRARLLQLGYSPLSVTPSLTALGHLGRWM